MNEEVVSNFLEPLRQIVRKAATPDQQTPANDGQDRHITFDWARIMEEEKVPVRP